MARSICVAGRKASYCAAVFEHDHGLLGGAVDDVDGTAHRGGAEHVEGGKVAGT
jgi:hypothetical protein